MRILITNTGSYGTGSFVTAQSVATELLRLGHEVKIFFPEIKSSMERWNPYQADTDLYHFWQFPLTDGKTQLEAFPLMIQDPHPRNPTAITFKQLTKPQFDLYCAEFKREISQLIDSFQPDVIECHHIWIMDHLLHQLGHAFISVAHHSDQMGFRYDPGIRNLAKQSAKEAQAIIAISDSVKQEVLELYGVAENKVTTIANGYDKSVFKPQTVNRQQLLKALQLDIPEDAILISFSGKLSLTKGIDTLLLANGLLKHQPPIHLLILGAGDLNAALDETLKQHCCFERCHFLGHQPPELVANIHNIAHLSVMPSRSEGFGLAGLEAMGCGIPLITTHSGGPESFAVGEVINPEQPQQLADAILKIVNLPEDEYQNLCLLAQHKAEEFSWKANVANRLELYFRFF